jgi:hypothetical protein
MFSSIRVTRWFLFTAAGSILPLLAVFFINFKAGDIRPLDLTGNGDLLLITWVLAVGVCGELIGCKIGTPILWAFFSVLLIMALSIILFMLYSHVADPTQHATLALSISSGGLFIAAVWVSCRILSLL